MALQILPKSMDSWTFPVGSELNIFLWLYSLHRAEAQTFWASLFCVFFYCTSNCFFVDFWLGRRGWRKVGMDKKTSLMGRTTSELKTGNLLPVFLVKSCNPGQWPGAFGLKTCSVYVTSHFLHKEVLVKSASLSVLVTVSSNKHLTMKTELRLGVWEETGQTSWAVLLLLSITFSWGGTNIT